MTTDLRDPALARGLPLSDSLYVRPAAFLEGAAAEHALADGVALPLSGGPHAFSLAEIIVRGAGGALSVHPVPVASLALKQTQEGKSAGARISEALDTLTRPRGPVCGLSLERPLLMGVINVTPDSFSDGGEFLDPARAIERGRALAGAGADILDIGGESTRPGAAPVAEETELARVIPVIEGLRGLCPLSIDTRRARVMEKAAKAGAVMINDVTGLTADNASAKAAAAAGTHVILTHNAEPELPTDPAGGALAVYDGLVGRIAACRKAGISEHRLIADPGIGFGKSATQNLEILRQVALYHGLGCPLLIGVSRKLGTRYDPNRRLPESLGAALWAVSQGVQILRVHDVAETRRALSVRAKMA